MKIKKNPQDKIKVEEALLNKGLKAKWENDFLVVSNSNEDRVVDILFDIPFLQISF